MTALYVANVIVLLVCSWAIWVRRLTFGSRWDAPFTYGIVFFGAGTAFDSPWSGVAAASAGLTGKYYLLNTIGHIGFLVGAAAGMCGILMRLMPDADLRRFMRSRIIPLVTVAALVMLTCVLLSPATSVMSADHLYLVAPDRWLVTYWAVFIGAMVIMEVISTYGLLRLRHEPDAVGVDAQIVAVAAGVAGLLLIGVGVATGAIRIPVLVVWPLSYVAIGGGALAAALMWRHRVGQLFEPPGSRLPEAPTS